jgi:CRISPR-associated protein Cmr3
MKAQRKRIQPGSPIPARLVAALVPKPIPVTGWALPHGESPDRLDGGAKSSHLAVPAGAIYYFEADSAAGAEKLAQALNWHGSDSSGHSLLNRRSTLLGEKGFGIGVCGTWNFTD